LHRPGLYTGSQFAAPLLGEKAGRHFEISKNQRPRRPRGLPLQFCPQNYIILPGDGLYTHFVRGTTHLPAPRGTILVVKKSRSPSFGCVRKPRLILCAVVAISLAASACAFSAANPWRQNQVIQPATLARDLQGSRSKPVLLQVGFESLYAQGHIPGSEYCGPARSAEGIANLKKCVQDVPRAREIVLYCGCCPWQECPNIHPAFNEMKAMGFSDVKVLYIAHNFGRDWAQKGYPVTTGK
jgi:hypothetical protein